MRDVGVNASDLRSPWDARYFGPDPVHLWVIWAKESVSLTHPLALKPIGHEYWVHVPAEVGKS